MISRHVIVVGFGLSGRSAANTVEDHRLSLAVIETNPGTVNRCSKAGLNIILGDAQRSGDSQTGGDRARHRRGGDGPIR